MEHKKYTIVNRIEENNDLNFEKDNVKYIIHTKLYFPILFLFFLIV